MITTTTHTLRRASLTAGVGLALMAVLAGFAVFGAISAQITPGDATRTAQDIAASQGVFRLGIAGLMIVVILDVIVATALYILFAPVDRMVAIMAAGFRIAYAAVYLVAIAQLVIAVDLLGNPAQALLAVNAYDHDLARRADPVRCPPAADRRLGVPIGLYAEDLRHPAADRRSRLPGRRVRGRAGAGLRDQHRGSSPSSARSR